MAANIRRMLPTLERMQWIKALTFDLYGTLVDWEPVWMRIAKPILETRGAKVDPARFCMEWKLQSLEMGRKRYEEYKVLLGKALVHVLRKYGLSGNEDDATPLIASWGDIRPFADVNDALLQLRGVHRLVILSNTDNDLIQRVLPSLPPVFDHVITAQDVGAYKPDRRMYAAAVERLGLPPSQVMHVARSQYDVRAALDFDMQAVWVNRAAEKWEYAGRAPGNIVEDIRGVVALLSRNPP